MKKSRPRLIIANKSPEGLYAEDDIFTPCWSIELPGRPGPWTRIPPLPVKDPIFTRDPLRLCTFSCPPAFNALVSPPPPERLPPPPPPLPAELPILGPAPPICDGVTPKPEKDRFPIVLLPGDPPPPGPDPPIPFMLLLKAWLPTTLIPARLVIVVCPWSPPCDNCCEPKSSLLSEFTQDGCLQWTN